MPIFLSSKSERAVSGVARSAVRKLRLERERPGDADEVGGAAGDGVRHAGPAAEPAGDQQRHGGDGAHALGEVEEERFAAAGALRGSAVAHGR